MREVLPTHRGRCIYPGSKPRTREVLMFSNLFDVKTMLGEKKRLAKAHLEEALKAVQDKPSQGIAKRS